MVCITVKIATDKKPVPRIEYIELLEYLEEIIETMKISIHIEKDIISIVV